jgi:glycerophosphoryl diester phosphodiesterase
LISKEKSSQIGQICTLGSPMTRIFAHRGASKKFKENTLEAFSYASDIGAQWIELDVWLSKDQILTVHHDEKLKNGKHVSSNVFSDFPSDVPSLQDVLDSTRGIGLNIEIKTRDNAYLDTWTEHLVDHLSAALAREGTSREFLISSFNYKALLHFKKRNPAIPVGLLIWEFNGDPHSLLEKVMGAGFQSIHPADSFVDQAFIEVFHRNNIDVHVWTVNEESRIKELLDIGVDGIFTDVPEIALSLV